MGYTIIPQYFVRVIFIKQMVSIVVSQLKTGSNHVHIMVLPVVLLKSITVCQTYGTIQSVEVYLYVFEQIEGGVIIILRLILELFVIVLHSSPYELQCLYDCFSDVSQAMVEKDCVGAIVCKLDMHKKMFRRGYIAMLAVDSKFRRKGIGKSYASMVALTSECQQKGSFYRTRVCFSVSSWIHLLSECFELL